MSIRVQEVSKFYKDQKALDRVSFEINSGKIAGFIGPNGAGKSTMMKIICGYIPQAHGEVTIAGYNNLSHSIELRNKIGYLPEHNPLYEEMYIREYLYFVAGLHKLKKPKQAVEEAVALTGLTKEQHKKIHQLSKGYRQRVGLAQSIIHDPEVLILDEPTTGLDPNQIVEIRELISRMGKKKTVMLSTHIMQEVEAICDRVIIINNGRIVADDTPDNIKGEHKLNDKKQTVIVEFSGTVTEDLLASLTAADHFRRVDNKWIIQSVSATDLREDIFQFAVDHDLKVLEMQKELKSLEEVFHKLTNQKPEM